MLAKVEPERNWFILLTEPQMERKAAAHLIGRRFKVYLPEELVWTTRGVRRRKVEIRRPMFRGYLFIRLGFIADGDRWSVVTSVPGVHKFMRTGDDYAIVPDSIMQKVAGVEEELLKPKPVRGPSAIFSPGETVRISDGPFSGFQAQIESLDDSKRITILLPFLGRASRTQILAEELEKL